MDKAEVRFKNKRVLITGGGGYLGAKLTEKIAPTGCGCYLFDKCFNLISTTLSETYHNVHLFKGDITDKSGLMNAVKTIAPHYVFHFAASDNRSRDFSIFNDMWYINVQGTLNLLEALQEIPYESFGFSSTSDIYGPHNSLPFHEDQKPAPVSPYSMTKLMAEELIRTWSGIYHKPFTIFRIFLFMGPGMSSTTFMAQLYEAFVSNREFRMTRGKQKRDYLMIHDLLECIIGLTGNNDADGEIINLCSGTSVSMKEIADTVQKLSGHRLQVDYSLPNRENEIWEICGSNEKLKRLLPDFHPVPLMKGIRMLFQI